FLPMETSIVAAAEDLRSAIGRRWLRPTSLGFGPRYLHSTGQLHKGGAANGIFLQITGDSGAALASPIDGLSFAEILAAQAAGDRSVLEARGRPIMRVHLTGAPEPGLRRLAQLVG